MTRAGAPQGRRSSEGRRAARVLTDGRGAAIAAACLGLAALLACVGPAGARRGARSVPEGVDGALALYASAEFVLAAQRFGEVAGEARALRAPEVERRARAAQCMAWLRARRLSELAACTARLEALQRRGRRSDPGVNTLLAVGAIAGGRPLPPYRLPNAVYGIVHAAAETRP